MKQNMIFIIALTILTLVKSDEELKLDEPTSYNSLSDGQTSYYTFDTPSNMSSGENFLVFDVSGREGEIQDPDIFLSAVNSHPTIMNSEWKCTAYGKDVCVIPKEQVMSSKKFYATVYCQHSCTYRVVVRVTKELELTAGKKVRGTMRKSESKLFRFEVSPDIDIHSISLTLEVEGNASMARMFAIIAKTQNDQPSIQNTIPVMSSWLGLSTRVFEDNARYFCRNCTYKVMVTTTEEMEFSLLYQTSKTVIKIKENQYQGYDVVNTGDRNCYEYNVKDANSTLEVYLNAFSGDPDIYVNPLTLPNRNQDFAFSSSGNIDEMLTISSEQRQKLNAGTGSYFICIVGSRQSSYGIVVLSDNGGETGVIKIHSGLTRTMGVNAGQLIVFEYEITPKELTNITFTLASLSGNADLYIKSCCVDLNDFGIRMGSCGLTKANLNSTSIEKSEQTASIDVINTHFDPASCSGHNKEGTYLIGVLGVEDSRFSLSVLGDSRKPIHIAEGGSIFGHVGLRQRNTFIFYVSDPSTAKVKIQLTSLSGDSDLYVSRINPYSGIIETERVSNKAAYLPDAVTYDKDLDGILNTTYTVTVYGHTSATFTLAYTTSTALKPEKSIILTDGVPQFGSINTTERNYVGARYHFFAYSAEAGEKDISVLLYPLTGSYAIYVGVDYAPTPSNYTWTTQEVDSAHETLIQIFTTDQKYKRDGTYHVLVAKLRQEDLAPHLFSVKYLTGKFAITMTEGQPEIGNLKRLEFLYYKYHVINLTTGSITATVTPLTGDPDLFVSISANNTEPNLLEYDYLSVAIGSDSIKIPVADFQNKNPSCSATSFSSSKCAIYIGVKCATEECVYSLQVGRSSEVVIKLLDGIPQYGTSTTEDPQFYVFSPRFTNETTAITIYPKRGKVKMYANLISWSSTDKTLKPTPQQHNFTSINRANTEMIHIHNESLRTCGTLCRVLIGVYKDLSQDSNGNDTSQFNIAATSRIKELIDSQTIVDYVQERKYRYYRFQVTCTECVLSISVNPLSAGDPDIYVNKGNFMLPSSEHAQFRAADFRGDFLQILPSDETIMNSRGGIRGPYVIGVFGAQNCTYALTVTTSASFLQDLTLGVPIKIQQQPGAIKYFRFSSWKKSNIQVSLMMRSGKATIRANAIESLREVNLLNNLPTTETNSTWSSLKSSTINRLIIGSNEMEFKENAYYFIAVEAQIPSDYDITVEYTGIEEYMFFKLAETYRINMNAGETRRYSFVVSSNDNINIHFNSFFGAVTGDIAILPGDEAKWKIENNAGLLIRHTDPAFLIGTYYVIFHARENSDFTFRIEQKTKTMWLSEGLPTKAEIEKGGSAYFYYEVPEQAQSETNFRLSIYATFKAANITNPVMYIRHVTRNDPNVPNIHNADYTVGWDSDLKQLGASLTLKPNSSRTIAVGISADFVDPLHTKSTFNIVAWTSGFALIIPEHKYMNRFGNLGEIHVYEVNLQQVNKAHIEVIPCTGEVEFLVTQTLSGINDRKFDIKKTELNKGRLFGTLIEPSGTYYISVRAVGLPSTKQAQERGIQYSIKAIVSNETTENFEDFSLEQYGNINSNLDGDELTLSWGGINKRGLANSQVDALFSVYITEDSDTNMYTLCGIKYGNTINLVSDSTTKTFTYNIRQKSESAKLTFNVIARIPQYDQSVAYNPLFFQIPIGPRIPRIYIIIAVVLFAVLAGIAIYYWRKYRSAMHKLEYEMSDARNMAQITNSRDFTENKAVTYAHLHLGGED